MNEWTCQVCSSKFSRPEHLKRHSVSHDNNRPHVCGGCGNAFNRRDSLRRHERTCKYHKLGTPNTTNISCGDFQHTHEAKRRCYSINPENFAHLSANKANAVESVQRQPELSAISAEPALEWGNNTDDFFRPDHPSPKCSLLREKDIPSSSNLFVEYGNDTFQSIPSPLDFSALDLLFSSQMNSDVIKAERLEHLAYFTSSMGISTFTELETFRWSQRMIADAYEHNIDPTPSTAENNKLTAKASELVKNLQEIITNKRNNDVIKFEWSPTIQAQCQEFFSPDNIRRFLQYFWSLWYPNCPIVHKPLFDIYATIPGLLCVMIVIGACLSPNKNDIPDASRWLDSAEELIFSHECFRGTHSHMDDSLIWENERRQSIQAGYLVCSLQKREGPREAQARIQRYRHTSIVTLARQIGIATASHRNLEIKLDSESWWRQFAEEEELMRTITFIFLIDAALAIFHNSPPRVVVSELKMDVCCPEACFQAETASECLMHLEEWTKSRFWRNRMSIVSVVRRICQDQIDDQLVREFSQLGTLNLFTMVQAIHSLMFYLQNSLVFETTLAPVQTGLGNWRRIWDQRIPEDIDNPHIPDKLWKQIGFLRHAPEYWLLARIKAAKIMSSAENDSEDEIHAPSRYDYTDMGDINGLVMEYRRLNLGMT